MKNFICLVCVASAVACGPRQPDDGSEQAAVAMLAQVRPGEPLDSMLWRLDQHLVNAMTGQLEDESLDELHRAEALTDRLLEARMPFEWITGEQYSVQSRLRQIQSLADRVIAEVETMAPREQLLLDLRELRDEVVELREALSRGGTRAPPSIEQLLSADSSRPPPVAAPGQADNAPAAPVVPAPLGVPVSTGG